MTICLTSCSRGYGCPYTVDDTIQKQNLEMLKAKEQKNAKSEHLELITKELETLDTEVIAD